MKAKFALLIKRGTITQERAYELASAAVGRTLMPGFGLSTCTHAELIRILDAVAGKAMSSRQTAEGRGQRTAARPLRRDGEARVSLDQARLERELIQEMRLSDDEVEGIFRRATGQYFSSRMSDHHKFVAALESIKRRRLEAAEDRDQRGEGRSQRSEGTRQKAVGRRQFGKDLTTGRNRVISKAT